MANLAPFVLLLAAVHAREGLRADTGPALRQAAPAPELGTWRAWLDGPGGRLAFGLELERGEEAPRAFLVNGRERIEVPTVRWEDGELVLAIEHYDSTLRARASEDGTRLDGSWARRAGPERWSRLPFHALLAPVGSLPRPERFGGSSEAGQGVGGRWAVSFEDDEEGSVAVFEQEGDGTVQGTFLTTLGDYRYLAGSFDGERLELSCFDGAHAFLFRAERLADGTLRGDFWSRDTYHDRWTARRDEAAALPDAFDLNRWTDAVPLGSLRFPDPEGREHALDEPAFAGRARILQLFGTWCPNCHDEAPFLVELHRRHGERGLSILGLAFELTGDFERDAEQVRRYRARHGVDYPILIAGTSDKARAGELFPLLDRVKAYPTTIFLDADGRPRAIHTGYAGPATGAAHLRLRERFETLIEELLSEPAPRAR